MHRFNICRCLVVVLLWCENTISLIVIMTPTILYLHMTYTWDDEWNGINSKIWCAFTEHNSEHRTPSLTKSQHAKGPLHHYHFGNINLLILSFDTKIACLTCYTHVITSYNIMPRTLINVTTATPTGSVCYNKWRSRNAGGGGSAYDLLLSPRYLPDRSKRRRI